MKKALKALICLTLCFATLFSFASCSSLRDAGGHFVKWLEAQTAEKSDEYTGGFNMEISFYYAHKLYWVETYEEAMTAIEHLRAAGNEMPEITIADYENDLVDAKYFFLVNREGAEKQQPGEEWYDRNFITVKEVSYYGFLEDVTIEELEYSYVSSYKHIRLTELYDDDYEFSPEDIEIVNDCLDDPIYVHPHGHLGCIFKNAEDGELMAHLVSNNIKDHEEGFPESFHEDFVKALVFIRND